jgi:hypothetical protein
MGFFSSGGDNAPEVVCQELKNEGGLNLHIVQKFQEVG